MLRSAGAKAVATRPDALTMTKISAERIVALLAANSIPFTGMSPRQASLIRVTIAASPRRGRVLLLRRDA